MSRLLKRLSIDCYRTLLIDTVYQPPPNSLFTGAGAAFFGGGVVAAAAGAADTGAAPAAGVFSVELFLVGGACNHYHDPIIYRNRPTTVPLLATSR